MILAFVEDGTVRIHASEDEARTAYEGVDVEGGVVTFYGEDGTWLEPVFTEPNRYGCLLGLIRWSASGTYRLEPRPDGDGDPIWVALLEHPTLEPALGIDSMDELKRRLRARGAVVDSPPGGGTPPPPSL